MKSSLLYLGLCILSLGSALPEPASNNQASANAVKRLVFDCADGQVGDTCLNMCYGAKCKRLGTTLTWDHPNYTNQGKRSRLAGCGSGNRCSKPPYGAGYQCDEFPFKSVKEAEKGNQVNRCVKRHYNSRQGGVLRQFYYSNGNFKGKGCDGKAPCKFSLSFKNFNKYGYCKKGGSCTNDGNEYTKAGPAKREEEVDASGYYRLGSGDVIYVPDGAAVGDLVYKAKFTNSNGTMIADVATPTDDDDEIDDDDEFDVEEDTIVEEVEDYE
ncbi:hypothetical protein P168DRAFT_327839 [Aspergillus campestris IBT 28561]|uniref:Deoxyribonuclease NucA/NucB domain-containing protein n=1 Tax=Aspergillus campestris (strain IBT 28561) TaxID=1392248 RepID=A0A2I1D1Q7_ASPC2|nr:uncharacterized protein P168DRAFT_327839 [Aspergillus campestris IBT 28561]PKY03800.1 hypothetical protein P168DRAFT_327839 [Aspergillus campestris IBT 28561]